MVYILLIFAFAVGVASGTPAFSATRAVPTAASQIQLSFAPIVRKAAPAVVTLYPIGAVPVDGLPESTGGPGGPQPLGSGVIVDPGGTIITNLHVIKEVSAVTIVLSDRREFQATVLKSDAQADLAVLRVSDPDGNLPYLEIADSDELQVGDLVLAIGNPFGFGESVTNGIVSALGRAVSGISDYRTYIQTDAAINPGNSGGALVDIFGRLIGINTALYSDGSGSVGIGFAIPANLVRSILADADGNGRIVRPWLGVLSHALSPGLARRLGLKSPQGVVVDRVAAGCPAARAGLVPGDVILSVNTRPIEDQDSLRYRFATLTPGTVARLDILRDDSLTHLVVHLVPPPEIPPRDVTALGKDTPLAGVTVANLSPALAEELESPETSGIIVLDIQRSAPAMGLHLAVGDIVTAVENSPVQTVDMLQQSLSRGDETVHIVILRHGHRLTLAAEMPQE